MKQPLIYLAAPYSSPAENIIKHRVNLINQAVARLFENKHHIYSPITHCHPIRLAQPSIAGTFSYWEDYNYNMLSRCDAMVVLCLPGWTMSEGVQQEIRWATEMKKGLCYSTTDLKFDVRPFPDPWAV